MKVTSIKQQVKRQGRYSIFVEGKYSFSLSDTALLQSKLVPGQELNDREIQDFKQLSDDDKALGLALSYAMRRPHSQWEMEQYFYRKKFSPLLSEQILSKLSDLRFIDDESFGRSWVSNRRLLRPTSRRKLQAELRAKHIADDIIQKVLTEDTGEDDEQLALQKLIIRKRQQARYQDDQKLMQYLARQGFSFDNIKAALKENDDV